ncbi:Techylectin-5B, partial [Stegodyphus mimosarum]
MELFSLFFYFTLSGILNVVSCNRERKIAEILDGVKRIEEHLKEEKIREMSNFLKLETTFEKLTSKVERALNIMENTASPIPRSRGSTDIVPGGIQTNLEAIDSRLRSLEVSVSSMEDNVSKMNLDAAKLEEIDRRTIQLKDDMNTKLRKMMNVITQLYELNKDMKSSIGSPRSDTQGELKSESGSSYATEFLIENLEELERKIKEQFSILTSNIRSEVTSLKIMTSSISCNNLSDKEDEEWLTPQDNARSAAGRQNGRAIDKVENSLDNLVESLGRSTNEIRKDIQQGMKDIDKKLNNLTVLAKSVPQCDPLIPSDSVASSRSIAPSYAKHPQLVVDDQKSTRGESCTKNVQNVQNPKSCADLRKGGATCDGIYVIFPQSVRAVRVYCDMTTDGGGWTVLMRRGDYGDKMTSFNKNWISYKNGFGDTEGEFWLGNDVINLMTTEDENMLRVHLSAFDDDEINLDYGFFTIGNESSNYRLHIGSPMGTPSTAANSLLYHNQHPFSTFDRKNDKFEQNCAAMYKGGWWFNGCYFGFLTGEYFKAEDKREGWQGILWYDWKGNAALKGAEMMIRPKNFIPRT